MQNDAVVYMYSLKPEKVKKKKKDTLNIQRTVEAFQTKTNSSLTYNTSVEKEFKENLKKLKEAGFFLR